MGITSRSGKGASRTHRIAKVGRRRAWMPVGRSPLFRLRTLPSGATGFRPPTSSSTGRCAEPLHYDAITCEFRIAECGLGRVNFPPQSAIRNSELSSPGGTRTPDRPLVRGLLSLLSYRTKSGSGETRTHKRLCAAGRFRDGVLIQAGSLPYHLITSVARVGIEPT